MALDDDTASLEAIAGGDNEGLVGKLIDGKYRVTAVLAKGGMGRIYRAEQIPLNRTVAVKVLHSDKAQDAEAEARFAKRFLHEAAVCASLHHPNIVVVHDYGCLGRPGDDACYMVMEYLEGRTLGRVIIAEGALAPQRALRLAREIARALRAAHAKQLVHRDLKPSNVMIVASDEGEQVKVLDFGIVKLSGEETENLTREGMLLGSPAYMAPEQIRRRPVDGRADIYALGVLLHEMSTGRPMFRGATPVQVLSAHLNDPPPPPPPSVPESVCRIIARCLDKDPEARFASAEDLIASIDEALAGPLEPRDPAAVESGSFPFEGVTAVHEPPAATARRWLRPVLVLAGAALLFVAGFAVTLALAPADDGGLVPAGVGVPITPPAAGGDGAPTAGTPATFTLRIESTPANAVVRRGETVIGATPMVIEVERQAAARERIPFRIEAPGYRPHTWAQGPADGEALVQAELIRLSERRTTARKPKGPKRPKQPAAPATNGADSPPPETVIKTKR